MKTAHHELARLALSPSDFAVLAEESKSGLFDLGRVIGSDLQRFLCGDLCQLAGPDVGELLQRLRPVAIRGAVQLPDDDPPGDDRDGRHHED